MKTPEFIYFDLGNVLVNFDHEIAINQLAALTNSSSDEIRQLVFHSTLQQEYEQGQLATPEFCQQIRRHTGSAASDAELCFAASDIFWVNHAIFPLVAALRGAGCRLGILSNTCEAHWQYIQSADYSILRLFQLTVLSFDEHTSKPSRGIYQAATRRSGFAAGELFFVDDRPDNVQGARDAGLDAVHYESPWQLAGELRKRGLRFNL